MSYCQGNLGSGSKSAAHNVTECSSRTILFSFDPTEAWPKEITHSSELDWPRVISDDFNAFRITSQSMAVLYCIGVGAMGLVLLVRASSVVAPRAQTGLFEFGFLVVSARVMQPSPHPIAKKSSISWGHSVLVLHRSLPRSLRWNLLR